MDAPQPQPDAIARIAALLVDHAADVLARERPTDD